MALKLYHRHRKECEGRHPEDSRSGEFEEGRRGWKRCSCLIHASGSLAGNFKRKQTGTSDWDEAKALIASWEAVNSWNGKLAPPPSPPASAASSRVTVMDATRNFLRHREGSGIARSTLGTYSTFTKQLIVFADSLGYVMLDQFTSSDIDVFYSRSKLGARTKGKTLGTLRAFFRFCVHRKWIPESPVSPDIKPPVGANRVANKAPFTDQELQRIFDACDKLREITWTNGQEQGSWNGEDVKDFLSVMVYTGLRISDVCLFNMNRLHGNEVFLRAKKKGGDVFTYIPDWLVDRLKARAKRHGTRPFVVGRSHRLDTMTDIWRRKINRVFELSGKFDERPTPHRFRHTFARILLQRGVPVTDVADLMGDDEKTIREHYSRWVAERQARLTKILKEAFEDKPKSRLIAVPRERA